MSDRDDLIQRARTAVATFDHHRYTHDCVVCTDGHNLTKALLDTIDALERRIEEHATTSAHETGSDDRNGDTDVTEQPLAATRAPQ